MSRHRTTLPRTTTLVLACLIALATPCAGLAGESDQSAEPIFAVQPGKSYASQIGGQLKEAFDAKADSDHAGATLPLPEELVHAEGLRQVKGHFDASGALLGVEGYIPFPQYGDVKASLKSRFEVVERSYPLSGGEKLVLENDAAKVILRPASVTGFTEILIDAKTVYVPSSRTASVQHGPESEALPE